MKQIIQNRFFKSLFFLSMIYSYSLSAAIDFGDSIAILQSISNNTPFDAELYVESAMGESLDLNAKVISGRIIRLRSKRIEGKPYVKLNQINGAYYLIANGTDQDDPATHFMIQQYVSEAGQVCVGLRSCLPALLGQGVVVGWQGTGEVFCTQAIIGQEDQKWSQWELFSDPNKSEDVWLRHVGSGGWLEAGPRFDRKRFEGNPLIKSKLIGEAEGKEWARPWINMNSVPDGTLRIGSPLRSAAATDAAAFTIELVSNPEMPENFKPFLGGLGFSLAAHGKHVALIGGKGEAYYAGVADKKWIRLPQNYSGGSVEYLKMIAIGEDKTTCAVNQNGSCFLYDWTAKIWKQEKTQPLDFIACSKADHIWAILKDKRIMQRKSSGWVEVQDLPNALPIAISVDRDGKVWVVGDDQSIYFLQDDQWITPALNVKAIAVSAADSSNVLILTPNYELKKLVPGKDFQNWQALNGKVAVMAITTQGDVFALGGDLLDDGVALFKGTVYQDSEIEPKNSFDMTPYRWPNRANGIRIAGNSSVELARLGFETKTGAGKFKGASFKRTPEIRGYSYTKPDKDFMRGSLLSLGSLWGRGYAWLERSFANPGSATVVFRAQAKAEGDLHIVLGERVGKDCLYRIVVGGDGNKVSAILKTGETVLENPVSVDRDPRAATMPGAFELYWVTIDNGLIMLGKGFPGDNIIMARRDSSPPVASNGASLIRNIGFSSFKSIDPVAIEVTEVVTMPTLAFMPPSRIFYEEPKAYDLTLSDQSKWLEKTTRISEEGSVLFTVQGTGTLRFRIAEEPKDALADFNGYEVMLSSHGPIVSQIRRNKNGKNTLVFENKLYGALFNSAQPTNYWISWKKGKVFVGHGECGENPFMVWQDPQGSIGVKHIGLASLEGKMTVSNVKLAGAVNLGFPDPSVSYEKSYDSFKMPTSLIIVEPIRLQMAQIGSSLQVIDKLQNKSYNVAGVAGAAKTIPYRFSLMTDGSASYEQLNAGKDSKQFIATEVGAKVLLGTAQLIGFMAPGFSLGGPIGIAAGLGLGAVGIGMQAKGSKLQASVDYARSRDAEYVFQEEFEKTTPSGSEITPAMQQNLARAEAEFDKADLLSPSNPEEYPILIKTYQNIILYANNAYVADNQVIKDKLFQGLLSMMTYYDAQDSSIDNDLLNLFASAYNNMYLVNMSDPDDKGNRESWGLIMTQIMERLFTEKNETEEGKGFTLQGLYGQYLWIPLDLPSPGRGYIEFEAKGLSDVMVAIAPKNIINVRNTETALYEIALGAAGNKKIVIRERSLAKSPLAQFNGSDLKKSYLAKRPGVKSSTAPDGMATPRAFSKYVINIEDGEIMIWQNQDDDKEGSPLLVFQDKYPETNDQFVAVGLSCWNTPVTFRNVTVAPCISDAPEEEEEQEEEELADQETNDERAEEESADQEITDESMDEEKVLPVKKQLIESKDEEIEEVEALAEQDVDQNQTVAEIPQNFAAGALLTKGPKKPAAPTIAAGAQKKIADKKTAATSADAEEDEGLEQRQISSATLLRSGRH